MNKKYPSPIRWGIIGCGDVTEVKSGPPYQLTEGFELAAVMRRDEEKLKDYAQRHNVPKYWTNADTLINDPEIDAVYIATPPDTHMHYALKVAAAGKPCCIEKPLAPSYKESAAILEAFTSKDTPLFVAYYRRTLPRFEQVHNWLKNNEIGKVRHVNWQLCMPPNEKDISGVDNWRTEIEVAPGGYFDDLASHGLDLITFFLGDIKEVHGFSLNQQNLYSSKDAFTACWIHNNEITGAGSWNFGSDQSEDRVEIFGSEGKIQFSIFDNNPIVLKNKKKHEELMIAHPKHVHQFHVEKIKKHLLNEDYSHPSTGATGAHTSWVMDKILGQL